MLGVFWLMSRLPFDAGLRLGRGLSLIFFWIFSQRRKATLTNLALAFPELNDKERTQRAKAVYKSVGMMVIETAWTWFRDTKIIEDRYTVSGEQHLLDAFESNKGLILLQAHFTALEITGGYCGTRWPIAVVYGAPKNPMVDEWLRAQRAKRIDTLIEKKNVRSMIRQLRKGNAVWLSPDQYVSRSKGGISTRYFNQPVLTTNGTARMVQMTDANVMLMIPTRHQNGKSYHIAFLKPVEFEHDDELSRTQTINDLFEDQVRHYPEQYLWSHKRFKPPPGEPTPYA